MYLHKLAVSTALFMFSAINTPMIAQNPQMGSHTRLRLIGIKRETS